MADTKYYTPEEATRTLPLVGRVVAEILHVGAQLKKIAPNGESSPENLPECERLAKTLNACFGELEALGCYYKDWNFSVGLVDFPARIEGEEVLLCWRSDEPELRFYHGLHDGYAGRKEIPQHLLAPQPAAS